MSAEWLAYVNDSRPVCKYGFKCYQKNPQHHETYKHPPDNHKRKNDIKKPDSKRFKPSPRDTKSPKDAIKNQSQNVDDKVTSDQTPSKDEPNTSATTATSTNEESKLSLVGHIADLKINLPEVITYHDKDGDIKTFKQLFLVEMPPDFFQFHKCLEADTESKKLLAAANLELIGPFDLLLGKLPNLDDKELYLIHWRFFFDPPEFQAILKKKGKSEFHIGYFRDSPDEMPVFVATNDTAKGCHITPVAYNIFGAVYSYLQNEKKCSLFASVACQKLMEKVKKWAEEYKFPLEEYNMKIRLAASVTKTFHGAGIVVPFNKKTELGYRKLVETDANLKKIFAKLETEKTQSEKDALLSELQPVITYANIAVDECDFGTGLEAGIDLFCSGIKELQPSALGCLSAAYSLLQRDAFGQIIQAHMKYRRKGPDMSVLSVSK